MDSAAQLALMAKAENVFSNGDTFLSFPVSPLSYRKAQLNLLDDANFANIIEFSMITNMIPKGIVWTPNAEDFLWNVYKSILQEATFASSTRTDDEETKYNEARDVLLTKTADGTINDSLQVTLYNHYQSEYENALQAYISQLSTAKSLTDPSEIQTWNVVTEPELRNNLANAQDQWETQGYRKQVETAKSVVESLGAKSPYLTWAEWSKSFNPDIDSLTRGQDQATVFPTSYTPANALDESSWQLFEISNAELLMLLSEAPREIRERLNASNVDSSIESLQFEFSSAKLLRPWFKSEVFRSKIWRFNDERLLSDGGNPPQGICPSYPVAVVFARNITIKTKQAPTAETKTNVQFDGFRILPNDPILLNNINLLKYRHNDEIQTNATSKIKTINHIGLTGMKTGQTLTAVAPPKSSQVRMMNPVEPRASVIAMKSAIPNHGKIATSASHNAPKASTMVKASGGMNMQRQANAVLLKRGLSSAVMYKRVSDLRPRHRLPLKLPQTPTIDDSIFILAFVCKPVPRCPNPDEDLQW